MAHKTHADQYNELLKLRAQEALAKAVEDAVLHGQGAVTIGYDMANGSDVSIDHVPIETKLKPKQDLAKTEKRVAAWDFMKKSLTNEEVMIGEFKTRGSATLRLNPQLAKEQLDLYASTLSESITIRAEHDVNQAMKDRDNGTEVHITGFDFAESEPTEAERVVNNLTKMAPLQTLLGCRYQR